MTKLKDYWDSFKVSSNNLIERIAQKLVELNMMAALPGGGPADSGNPGKGLGNLGGTMLDKQPGVVIFVLVAFSVVVYKSTGSLLKWAFGAPQPRQLEPHEQEEGKHAEVRLREIEAAEFNARQTERRADYKRRKEEDDNDSFGGGSNEVGGD